MGLKAAFKEGGEAFTIFLGILFGAVLVSFIFAFLVQQQLSTIPNVLAQSNNETGFLNSSGYTLLNSSLPGANSPVVVTVLNGTSGALINSLNYTLIGNKLYNATNITYTNALVTYTISIDDPAQVAVATANGQNSQGAISSFTGNSSAVGYILVTFLVLGALIGLYALYKKSSQGNEGMAKKPNWGSQSSNYD